MELPLTIERRYISELEPSQIKSEIEALLKEKKKELFGKRTLYVGFIRENEFFLRDYEVGGVPSIYGRMDIKEGKTELRVTYKPYPIVYIIAVFLLLFATGFMIYPNVEFEGEPASFFDRIKMTTFMIIAFGVFIYFLGLNPLFKSIKKIEGRLKLENKN